MGAAGSTRLATWGTAALAALVLGLYLPTLRYELVDLDDVTNLVNNPHVRGGLSLSALSWAFTSTWASWWYPLTWLTHLTAISLFGDWAGGHHLVNALFHAANAALAVMVFRRWGLSSWQSLAGAALTVFHPTRVESVAWVTERKDLVFVFFGLLTLLAYALYAERRTPLRYALVLLAYAGSLMGKSMLVSLPVLLLLLDVWQARGVRLLEKLPMFALALGAGVMTVYAQRQAGAVQSLTQLTFPDRLAVLPLAYLKFLALTFWPIDLCAYYPRPEASAVAAVLGWVAALVLVGLLFALRKRAPSLLFGAAWFVISLAPVSGLAQVGGALAADRYLYWPHLGLFAGLVLAIPAAWMTRPALRIAAAAVVATLALLTTLQLPMWRDSETLFRSTLELEPNNPFMQTSLGLLLLKQGRAADAVAPLSLAAPRYPYGQSILGLALIDTGDLEGGRKALDEALARSPNDADLKRNVELGRARLQGR
jgi:hypothetical protein